MLPAKSQMIECFGLLNLTLKVHYISFCRANAVVRIRKSDGTFETDFVGCYHNEDHN